jgi:hypothetical protein
MGNGDAPRSQSRAPEAVRHALVYDLAAAGDRFKIQRPASERE